MTHHRVVLAAHGGVLALAADSTAEDGDGAAVKAEERRRVRVDVQEAQQGIARARVRLPSSSHVSYRCPKKNREKGATYGLDLVAALDGARAAVVLALERELARGRGRGEDGEGDEGRGDEGGVHL